MDLQKYLLKNKSLVEKELEKFINQEINILKKSKDKLNQQIIEHIKEYTLRDKGKRIRSALVVLAYEMFGGQNHQAILKAAIAYELAHAGWLMHDDIIDRDDLRRGKPSMHRQMQTWLKNKKVNSSLEHYGSGMAILAGDLSVLLAHQAILNSGLEQRCVTRMLGNFERCMLNTIYGENLDVLVGLIDGEIKTKEVLRVNELKTARYTFDGPLQLGALAAGATENQLKILSDYALPVGNAFQIRDDNVGMFGSTEEIGKSAGSDLKEGKITLLILNTLRMADQKSQHVLIRLLGKKSLKQSDLKTARQIIKDSGALDATQSQARELVKKGINALNKLKKIQPNHKNLLISIADYIIERKY